MKPNTRNRTPFLITALAVALVSFLYMLGEQTKNNADGKFRLDIFDRVECMTYDMRVRMAAAKNNTNRVATNLATLFIDDTAIERLNIGWQAHTLAPAWDDGNMANLTFGVPWPRFIYGQMVRELSTQKVKAIGFDIFFSELDRHTDDTDVISVENGETNRLSSDEFFGHQIAYASNVVLATQGELMPHALFAKGALSIGNISSTNDYGVLRRVRAFGHYKVWNERIVAYEKSLRLVLSKAEVVTKSNLVKIPRIPDPEDMSEASRFLIIPLHSNGNLKLSKDGSLKLDDDDPKDIGPDNISPYRLQRAWNLGIALAAYDLGLDLEKAIVEPNRITLNGPNGITRVIPTEEDHSFYIDWTLRWEDIRTEKSPVYLGAPLDLLYPDFDRHNEGTNKWESPFANRLVVVGSVATGNNLTDVGATPLEPMTPLVTKHLNVANSILTGRFINKASIPTTIALILALGAISGLITWRTPQVVHGSIGVAVVSLLFILTAFYLYIQQRYWLPIVIPVFGGLLLPHFALVTYRVIFEQKGQRMLKSIFQSIVAPEIVDEIVKRPDILDTLGGARLDISVYFADVRGFTEFTDKAHEEALKYIADHKLSEEEEKKYLDKKASETMETVNLYLGIISGEIKHHSGTLDKYIGDCVMAFWGAPIPQEQHALCAVRAAIDSQRAMYAANQERAKENERRKEENLKREARGEEPLHMYPLLTLGSGINSGDCIVGMMGSVEHTRSYTVFGREVNLASRLEGVSGRGRIIVSQRTYEECKKYDPEIAATFVELESVKVKGIRDAVRIYEVPWKLPDHSGATMLMTKSEPAADPQHAGLKNA